MKGKRYKLRVAFHQGVIRLHDGLGHFAEAGMVFILGAIFLVIAFFFKIGSPSDWAAFCAAFLVTSVSVFLMRRAMRQHEILVEVTMSYLIHGGKSFLDYLLGKLIGGRWKKDDLKPGDALFDVLETIASGQDWEMKRRIVEALPALGEVNIVRAMKIAAVLREDWEPTRWHGDLRRRTIEALTIPATPRSLPLIDRANPGVIRTFFELREKDQVYTAMAIAEGLHEWGDTQPDLVSQLMTDFLEFSVRTFSQEEMGDLNELVNLLKLASGANLADLERKLQEMSKSSNILQRVAAARNVLRLSERLPEKTLDLMFVLADTTQPNNVRRPIAKEQSMKFVLKVINNRAYQEKAEKLLFKLISDPDEIIRITAFDMAESLIDQNRDLLARLCDFILARESSPTLIERCNRVKGLLSECSTNSA